MPKHQLVLYWMLLAVGVVIAAIVCWHLGLFHLLFKSDVSRLSLVIIMIFLAASAHAAYNLVRFSNLIEILKHYNHSSYSRTLQDTKQITKTVGKLPSWLQQYLSKLTDSYGKLDTERSRSNLLDTLNNRVKAPVRLGWLLADLLIKLGLLGTVIGFILMLGAISGTENLDITNIQMLLVEMGSGMRVALFTTLSGLVAGTLLGFQYFIVDRSADVLMAMITELIEIDTYEMTEATES